MTKNNYVLQGIFIGWLLITLISTTPAFPVKFHDDLDVSGSFRFRYELGKNHNGSTAADGYTNSSSDSFMLSQMRLYFKKEIQANSTIKLTLQDARKLGAVEPGNDDGGLGIYELYWRYSLTEFAALKIGRQTLSYGKQRLISPLGWSNQGRSFEGIKGLFNLDGFGKLDTFFMTTSETQIDTDESRFSGVYFMAKNEVVNYDLYYLNKTTASTDNKNTVGLRLDKQLNNIKWDAEYILQSGNSSSTVEYDAYAWVIRGEYALQNLLLGPIIRGEYSYASGDKPSTATKNEAFDHLYPLAHAYNGYIDIHKSWTNLKHLQLGIGTKDIASFEAWIDYHKFNQVESTGSDDYGQEIDLVFKKKIDHFTVSGGPSIYFPGNMRSSNASAWWAWVQVSSAF